MNKEPYLFVCLWALSVVIDVWLWRRGSIFEAGVCVYEEKVFNLSGSKNGFMFFFVFPVFVWTCALYYNFKHLNYLQVELFTISIVEIMS